MGATMVESADIRTTRIPLNHGTGHMPALGFGTLIPDPAVTISATRDALDAGFRHFDCAERYRNEREVGEALQAGLAAGGIPREDIFVTTKLWNSNHRPERVEPAFQASLDRLGLKYLDLYLIHTPFAFQPGDEQDPRDENGNVIYDRGVTLLDTWRAMESLMDQGKCLAIGSRISPWTNWRPSMNWRESSRPWYRWRRIHICRKRSFWNSALEMELCSWPLHHWVTGSGQARSKIPSSPQSRHGLQKRRHRCCWLGPCNAAQPCSPRLRLQRELERTSTSPPFRKTLSMRSMEFRLDRG
jgi:Aldo/keto reductase family